MAVTLNAVPLLQSDALEAGRKYLETQEYGRQGAEVDPHILAKENDTWKLIAYHIGQGD